MTKKKMGTVNISGKPKHSLDENRENEKSNSNRSAATVRRLKMYNTRPNRDSKGKVLFNEFQSKDLPNTQIQPDRRWFGNTRVISQKELEFFREEHEKATKDRYRVILTQKTLPSFHINQHMQATVELLNIQPFSDTFGPNAKRKRPKLWASDYESLTKKAVSSHEEFEQKQAAKGSDDDGFRDLVRHSMFDKGQSKRIWGELYKVVDSSDVVVQVLDARDPQGTRCHHLEKQLLQSRWKHKTLILLLNKCDLVSDQSVLRDWKKELGKEYPTIAFHADLKKSYGKETLLSFLRQISGMMTKNGKQSISVGFVGYPNVGKSSVINTLSGKNVCNVAPIPGETKLWQYITLTNKINLIDCPGVVYGNSGDSETDCVLKGVVRVTNLEDATEHIGQVLKRVEKEHLKMAYKIEEWEDENDFLVQLCKLSGRLLKGGEADVKTAAKMILSDWQRGKLPYSKRHRRFRPPTSHVAIT